MCSSDLQVCAAGTGVHNNGRATEFAAIGVVTGYSAVTHDVDLGGGCHDHNSGIGDGQVIAV